MGKVEVRAVIKYFCKKGMSPKETHDNIKNLGDHSPSYSMGKWAAEFRRESVEDYKWSGTLKRLSQTKMLSFCSLIMCDRRSLCDIARQIGISFGAVQSILAYILGMSIVSARWVFRMLTKNQKSRLDISKYLLSLWRWLRNLWIELWLKMRIGSITLILRPKSRVCSGSTLAHLLLRNVRVFSAGNVMTSIFWEKPTDLDLHCLPFSIWSCINTLDQVIWLAEN